MPRVLALGRWWSADELDAIARRWRTEVVGRLGEPEGLIATALPARWMAWRFSRRCLATVAAGPAQPRRPRLAHGPAAAGRPAGLLPPSQARSARRRRGSGSPRSSSTRRAAREWAGPPLALLRSAGVIIFTSGSTGLPRAVFRDTAGLLAVSRARIARSGCRPGGGILMGVSLASGQV